MEERERASERTPVCGLMCILMNACLFVLTIEKVDAKRKYEIISGPRKPLTFCPNFFSNARGIVLQVAP